MRTDTTCDVITQLRKSRQAVTKPVRMDILASSPYPTYTQEELNMRRKAEILQYNSNYQSTKQNGTTRSQRYSQIVNGTYQNTSQDGIVKRTVTNGVIVGNSCPVSIVSTPTTSSDVPGKVQLLYLDPSIPLYNYTTDRTYNVNETIDNSKWNVTFEYDVKCDIENASEVYVASIYIRDGIDSPDYTFSLTIPVTIQLGGTNNELTDYDLDFSRNVVDVYIKSATCMVYYNDYSLNNASVVRQVTPTTYLGNLRDVSLNTLDSASSSFSARVFIGHVIFSNISLYTTSGYSYDFKIKMNGALNVNDTSYFQSDYFESPFNYSAIFNSQTADSSLNCLVSSDKFDTSHVFSISGTNPYRQTTRSSYSIVVGNTISSSTSFDPTTIAVSNTFTPTTTKTALIQDGDTVILDLLYPKTGYLNNYQSYYGSKTTFTLTGTTMTVKSDGDPYPAKCGAPFGYLGSGPTNDIGERIWYDDPNPLLEAKETYSFTYRGGTVTTATSSPAYYSSGDIQGMFANGVSVFSPQGGSVLPEISMNSNVNFYLDAFYYVVFLGKDKATGHPEETGQYHYHTGAFLYNAWNNSTFYNSNTYYGSTYYTLPTTTTYSKTYFSDNNLGVTDHMRFADGHSKIVGFLFDGYPIYGPFGYTSATSSISGCTIMTSSYVLSTSEVTNRPYNFTDTVSINITSLTALLTHAHSYYNNSTNTLYFGNGAYINDYIYTSSSGTLDIYNGRYCVTPDYPSGTYAYFLTLDAATGTPKYPYIIGNYSKQTVSFTTI